MSVAFRREGDDEHKEPEFELPIPVGPNLVTERGLALIAAKETALKAAIAAAPDDETAKKLKRELRYWATQHATARLAPAPEPGEAGVGSLVTVRRDGREQRFRIVGHDEADPAAEAVCERRDLLHLHGPAGREARVHRRAPLHRDADDPPVGPLRLDRRR